METREPDNLCEHPAIAFIPTMRSSEYALFKQDIAERGILDAIRILEDGTILDGRHRWRVARELGLNQVPVEIISLNGIGVEEYAIRAAILRRHLSDDQRAVLAQVWQKRESKKAQSEAGKKAVSVRDGLIDSDTVSESMKASRDTRAEAAKLFNVPERKVKTAAQIEQTAPELLQQVTSGELTLLDAKRQAKRKEREEHLDNLPAAPEWNGQIELDTVSVCAIEGLELEPDSIDMIFTDPPYHDEFLHLYGQLGKLGARVLKPGAYLMVYCGKMFLPTIMQQLGGALEYVWTFGVYQPDSNQKINKHHLFEAWRPILCYKKPGDTVVREWQPDMVRGTRDKDYHEWQQQIEPALKYIGAYTNLGDIVLDPFVGGGTTVVACRELKRHYLAFDKDPNAVKVTLERVEHGK